MPGAPETNLITISRLAIEREIENIGFRSFLKAMDGAIIDGLVHRLNDEISAQIDCTTCGNCCKTFMISVEPDELLPLADHLEIPVVEVQQQYLEQSGQGNFIINTIPCHFLADNKCTIYNNRFSACREFPHLHMNGFTQRLQSVVQHYAVCPIVFNVVEALKTELDFVDE